MYALCVLGENLRIRMSSIMRCRNGETRDDASMALLLLRSEAACLVPQHKQIHDPAQPHRRNEARVLPRERFSPSTLTRRSDLSEADGQQIKLTGSCGEQREG